MSTSCLNTRAAKPLAPQSSLLLAAEPSLRVLQLVASMTKLGITDEITNVNGGAIALGHPIGMSGTRVALHLLLELKRRGGGKGAAALCGGGGQGDAILLETI